MNIYSSLNQIEEYRGREGISQSFLKMVLSNNSKPFKETVPMIIGSVFDCMLTSPELTQDLFCVGLEKRPSDTIKAIIEEMFLEHLQWLEMRKSFNFEDPVTPSFEDYRSDFIMKARIANYNKNWGDEAIWNAIRKDGESYWNELISSGDKMIVTRSEWERCEELANLTLNNSVAGKYFINQNEVNKYFQFPIYWKYRGHDCKGLLDILLFENETKTIYYIDIKSTGAQNIEQWFDICRSKNYPFQMAWYYEGIKSSFQSLISDGWSIKMRWMVIPTSGPFKPWIVPVTEEMLHIGKFGFSKVQNYEIDNIRYESLKTMKGFEQALSIFEESKLLNLNDYDTFYYHSNGKLSNAQSRNLFLC